MSGPRLEGESFDDYRARRKKDKAEELLHKRGHLAFVAVQYYEKDGKKYRRSRTYVAPKKVNETPIGAM